jgi:uncharacterized protein YegJ (DUF2314 family)
MEPADFPVRGTAGSAGPDLPVRIPLPSSVEVPLGIYFRSASRRLPPRRYLRGLAGEWLTSHASGALRTDALAAVEGRRVAFDVFEKAALPPARSALACCGLKLLGPEGERLYRRATHCVRILTANSLLSPWVHLWAGLGAARGIAAGLEGIIYDLRAARFLLPGTCHQQLPAAAWLGIVQHLSVLYSIGERGLGWVTTKGLEKFGLPNLEFRDVPPNLTPDAGRVMNGVAQKITGTLAVELRRPSNPPGALVLDPEIVVKPADVAAAYAPAEFPTEEEPRGPAAVRLEYSGRGRGGLEPFVTLCPPRGFGRSQGAWLYGLVEDLLGLPEDRCVRITSHHGALREAHRRAVARLEEIRRRFQAGLPTGEVLMVKLGFNGEKVVEYMWVAVNTWKGNRLQGQLANEPEWVKDLKAGDPIELDQSEVFDWEIHKSDGTREGGYSTAVLQGKPLPE